MKPDDTRLATISSVDSARVVFHVDEVSLLRLRRLKKSEGKETPYPVGMGRADEKGFPHSGTLDLDDLRIDVKTDTVVCRAVFPNADGTLMPGMFARVRVATSTPYKTLAVDARAIHNPVANGSYYVLVVNERNIVEKREVQLTSQQGLWGIKSGLKAEDWIVVKYDRELKAGMTVQPKRVVMKDPPVAPPKKLPEKKTHTEAPPASAKLRDLIKERHAVLIKVADVVTMQYQAGLAPLSAVMQARQAVIEAGLDLCETHAERIALLRENLKLAAETFKLTQARLKVDRNGETGVLQAQAMLLDAQIRLLRDEEKAKEAK